MIRIIAFVVALFCGAFFANAETVSLSGTVKKTGGSAGIAGVKVGLKKINRLWATSDANGVFTISGSTPVLAPVQNSAPLQFILKDKVLALSRAFPGMSGKVEIFSSDGARKAVLRFQEDRDLRYGIRLPDLNSGISVLRLTIGNETHTQALMSVGTTILIQNTISSNAASGILTLAKNASSVVIDTLIAEKDGYMPARIPLDTYTKQNIAVTLDSGSQPAGLCSRQVLQDAVDSYIKAQEAGDPSKMLLAPHVRYIENLDTITEAKSICKKALPVASQHHFFDVDSCRTFSEVVVTGGGHPYVIGMRLRVVDGKICEIDAIVTDSGDWLFNAKRYLDTATVQNWDTLPLAQRSSRQTLINCANAYGAIFEVPHTDTIPFGTPCSRLEGGTPAVCTAGFPTGSTNHKLSHRDFVVDVNKGVISMFCFLEVGGKIVPKPDSHLLKLINGKIRYVHTLTIWDE
jgi:hypothetical protein